MVKRIGDFVRRQLLKVEWIKRAVENWKARRAAERYHQRWANRMSTGYTIRNLKPGKLRPFETHAVVTDEGLSVEYINGRIVGQDYSPVLINSVNWGVERNSEDSSNRNTTNHNNNTLPAGSYTPDGGWHTDVGPCTSERYTS